MRDRLVRGSQPVAGAPRVGQRRVASHPAVFDVAAGKPGLDGGRTDNLMR